MSPRRAQFLPADVLRLEVETTSTALPNLVLNPDGALGGWGWLTPFSDVLTGVEVGGQPRLRQTTGGTVGATNALYSEPAPVAAGQYVAASFLAPAASLAGGRGGFAVVEAYLLFTDERGDVNDPISSVQIVSPIAVSPTTRRGSTSPVVAPAGTRFVSLGIQLTEVVPPTRYLPAPGSSFDLTQVSLTAASSAGAIPAGVLPYLPPAPYVNVLGSTNTIEVHREELNVGTLVATIVDTALDPADAASDLRPGRRIRLMSRIPETGFDDLDYGEGLYGGAATEWTPLFVGKIEKPSVKYDLLHRDPGKRSRITLTAVDALTALSRQPRSEGVASIDELPYVLEGAGIPWNVNGSDNQVSSSAVTVVSMNDNASAVDQVAMTRDTVLGYAWVDRFGVLQAWDADQLISNRPPSLGGVTNLDEADYGGDIDVDFDTDLCINAVTVVVQQVAGVTGEADQLTFGPFRDEASIRANGVRSATYTVHGLSDDQVAAYGAAILAANAQPRKRINKVTIPVRRLRAIPKALTDVGEVLEVSNTRAGIRESYRVTAVDHSISASSVGTKWSTSLSFAGTDRVATATVVPAPSPGGGGKTIGELYRPVGEVTMWFGAAGAVPAGWLRLDGATFSAETYPKLAALLGSTTLPNMVDRFPVGAGTKALGTPGGAATVVLRTAQMPEHDHSIAHNHDSTGAGGSHSHTIRRGDGVGASAGRVAQGNDNVVATTDTGSDGSHSHGIGNYTGNSGSRGAGDPIDILPPWRALHFIIRAV